jgi:hypothetical protein
VRIARGLPIIRFIRLFRISCQFAVFENSRHSPRRSPYSARRSFLTIACDDTARARTESNEMARTELGPFPPGEAVLQAMSASQGAEILEWFKSPKSLTSLSAAVKPRCKAFSRNILYKDHLAVPSNVVCQRVAASVSDRWRSVRSTSQPLLVLQGFQRQQACRKLRDLLYYYDTAEMQQQRDCRHQRICVLPLDSASD